MQNKCAQNKIFPRCEKKNDNFITFLSTDNIFMNLLLSYVLHALHIIL